MRSSFIFFFFVGGACSRSLFDTTMPMAMKTFAAQARATANDMAAQDCSRGSRHSDTTALTWPQVNSKIFLVACICTSQSAIL